MRKEDHMRVRAERQHAPPCVSSIAVLYAVPENARLTGAICHVWYI
jgi:hypothetical protein